MKKLLPYILGVALIFAIGFKIVSDLPQKPTYLTLGAAQVTPAVRTASPADAAANGICRGTLTVDVFAPEMGIDQATVDAYTTRYTDEARSCDELTFLGVVQYPDGSADYIYRMNIAGKPVWYIFTVTDDLVTNIQ